jgi:hypothetical protein
MQPRLGTLFKATARLVQMTVRDALNSAMDEEMEKDSSVFILGEEVKFSAVLCRLAPLWNPCHGASWRADD